MREKNEKLKNEYENKLINLKNIYEKEIKEIKEENEKKLRKYEEYKKEIEENMQENEMIIKYKINENEDIVKIFGQDFVEYNKNTCKIIFEEKEYDLQEKFDIKNYNKKKKELQIKLKGKLNNMCYMFNKCSSLLSLVDINKFNTNNIKKMNYMFSGCSLLSSLPDISKWNTKNATSMNNMFNGCSSLSSLPDISKWNTTNVINNKTKCKLIFNNKIYIISDNLDIKKHLKTLKKNIKLKLIIFQLEISAIVFNEEHSENR